jgi:hypothetical protein
LYVALKNRNREWLLTIQMGWWGEMGGPKQKGVVQYSKLTKSGGLKPS